MGVQLIPQTLKIKTLSYTIVMPAELQTRMAKPVTGEGGWQSLMKGLQAHVDGSHLELPQALLIKMVPMATQYGAGGYQGVIRWILCLLMAQHSDAILGKAETLKDAAKGAA